ncbi:hypothetical protein SB49_14320 [Sediminicola sp. YIK13]|uniref:hypothetical protein n=1 Tax=Sediminicola sp. YIK13 TaxID=1453352 RepID=UPI00071EF385|nr:hypothetical protein [Sediminicola sp. YIK13]ALM08840.1 hypothetical protein SB49_14320 [Sediminicola sp. YIK13]
MKTIKISILLLTFSFLGFVQAQEPTVIITLTVDTAALGNDHDAPGGCSFTVSPADKVFLNDPNDPKSFTILVEESDIIEWQGITTTGDDVKIKKISFIGGIEIFGSNNIFGRNENGKEKVKAKPNRRTPPGQDYIYAIRFRPDGFSNYNLDPRIRVGIE